MLRRTSIVCVGIVLIVAGKGAAQSNANRGAFTSGLKASAHEVVDLIGQGVEDNVPRRDLNRLNKALQELLLVLEDGKSGRCNKVAVKNNLPGQLPQAKKDATPAKKEMDPMALGLNDLGQRMANLKVGGGDNGGAGQAGAKKGGKNGNGMAGNNGGAMNPVQGGGNNVVHAKGKKKHNGQGNLGNQQAFANNAGNPFGNQQAFGNNMGNPFGNQQAFANNAGNPFGNQQGFGNAMGMGRQQTFGGNQGNGAGKKSGKSGAGKGQNCAKNTGNSSMKSGSSQRSNFQQAGSSVGNRQGGTAGMAGFRSLGNSAGRKR